MIYHITSQIEAAAAELAGEYTPQQFAADGFIHCSYAHQVTSVADRRFKGRTDLVLLEVDPGVVRCKIIDENLEGGAELFPHIYGPLPMSAVRIHRFPCNDKGCFEFSEGGSQNVERTHGG